MQFPEKQCYGPEMVSVRIRIKLFPSMRIRIHVNPDHGQTLPSQKFDFDMNNILYVDNMT
jgi:hypothetical protein